MSTAVNDAMTGACANTSPVPKSVHITGAESPEELPAYTAVRAAQIVRLSPSTLRLWAGGDGEQAALFVPAERSPLTLSFSNLVETFVLASMRKVHGISMQRVRKALRFIGRELGVQRPLIHARFRTDGVRLLRARHVEEFACVIDEQAHTIGAEARVDERALNAELATDVPQRLPDPLHRDSMHSPHRRQHEGFDQV